MAHNKIHFKHPQSGAIKEAPVGFSWTTLFFGFFPALIRRDGTYGLLQLFLTIMTWGLSGLVFCFIYNKLYIKDLIRKGFISTKVDNGTIKDVGLRIGLEIPTEINAKVNKALHNKSKAAVEQLSDQALLDDITYYPSCLNCGVNLDTVTINKSVGLSGGSLECSQCNVRHDFYVSSADGVLNLSRYSIPEGYTGEKERKFYPGAQSNDNDYKIDFASMTDNQFIDILEKLCKAYTNNDTETYPFLEKDATQIGEILNNRGGIEEMRRIFHEIPGIRGKRTLEMHWGGIGEWRG